MQAQGTAPSANPVIDTLKQQTAPLASMFDSNEYGGAILLADRAHIGGVASL